MLLALHLISTHGADRRLTVRWSQLRCFDRAWAPTWCAIACPIVEVTGEVPRQCFTCTIGGVLTYLVRPTSHTTPNACAWLTHVLSRSVDDGKHLVDVGETRVNDVQANRV